MNIKGSLTCNNIDVSSHAHFNELKISKSIQSPHITSSSINAETISVTRITSPTVIIIILLLF